MVEFVGILDNIQIDGNVIRKIKNNYVYGTTVIYSPMFFVLDEPRTYNINGKIKTIECSYYEVTVSSYSIISVGIVNGSRYIFNDPNDDGYEFCNGRHIGWDDNSIGIHSDDGNVYSPCMNPPTENVCKPYGLEIEKENVVGCGFRQKDHVVFFTLNGEKIFSKSLFSFSSLNAAIGLEQFDTLKINYGDEPFKYKLEEEL